MNTSEHSDLLARYDKETRRQPAVTAGLSLDESDGVIALVGHFNFVCSWRFSDEQMESVVNAWADRFKKRGEELMWPVYSHDQPQALPTVLEKVGFVSVETETLLVVEARQALRAIKADDTVDVRRIRDAAGLQNYLDVGEAAFGVVDTQGNAFLQRLNDPDIGLYVAYADGKPAAAGRIEMNEKRSFAELFGGGVIPTHRGTGLYKALVTIRAQAAVDYGSTHLATTARETSRPILEKLGFFGLGTRTTWMLRP